MPNASFQYDDITITVREGIGRDEIDGAFLNSMLLGYVARQSGIEAKDVNMLEWNRITKFTDIFLRSTVAGDLHLSIDGDESAQWRNIDASPSDVQICAMYDGLMNAKPELAIKWQRALRQSDLEEIDPKDSPAGKK